MSTPTPPPGNLHLVGGYDGSPPAIRALDEKLRDQPQPWDFQMRQGLIAEELIAAAESIRDAHPEESVVIVVGSSSHATHRVVGSVAVSLARHSPVPLVVVP